MLVEMRMLGEVAAEGAHTRLAVEQPKDVARHLIQPPALDEHANRTSEEGSVLLAEDADPLLPRVRGLTGSAQRSARPG